MEKRTLYFYLIMIAILFVLSFLIVKPLLTAIIFAMVIAYFCDPLHKKLSKIITPRGSALLISALVLVVIILIIQYGTLFIIKEFSKISTWLSHMNLDFLSKLISSDAQSGAQNLLKSQALQKVISAIVSRLTDVLNRVPAMIFSLFVFVISFFYFLIDGEKLYLLIKKIVPLPHEKRKVMMDEIKRYIDAYMRVQLLVGLIQGVVCAVGFYLFGLPYIVIAGLTAAILSILPIIGPYILYVPIGLALVFQGDPASGFGLMAYGLIIGSFLDYLIRPHFIGKYAKVHPLIIIVGVFGGITAFGLVGVIAGPLILLVLVVIIKEMHVQRFLSSVEHEVEKLEQD